MPVARPFRGEAFPNPGKDVDGATETLRPEGPSYRTGPSRDLLYIIYRYIH